MEQILFFISAAVTLIAALLVVTQRSARRAAWCLGLACAGVAGVLALLGAPVVAGVQLAVCVGCLVFLPRLDRQALREATRRERFGSTSRWWAAGLLALALLAVLIWAAVGYEPAAVDGAAGGEPAGLVDYALPLGVGVALFVLALAGAVRIARRR